MRARVVIVLSLVAEALAAQEPPAQVARPIPVPAAAGAMCPNLSARAEGVLLTWLEPDGLRYSLEVSRLHEGKWTKPTTIHEGAGFFANWADFPAAIEADDGTRYAHWLMRSGSDTYAYDVRVARSRAGGPWQPIGKLHRDDKKSQHGFVSFVREKDGVRAFWLDGRRMQELGGTMQLMTARVGDTDTREEVIDADVCTCCQTSAAMTDSGPIVVYRDHAEGEIRDISIVRRTKTGWAEPKPVHGDGWEFPGCPVNGPSVDARGGVVAVAWFTCADDKPRVLLAFSRDDGASFDEPIVVDDANPIGRVAVCCLEDAAAVCWLARAGKRAVVTLRRVTTRGALGTRVSVGTTGSSRAAGFPRMARAGNRLVLAWRELTDEPRLRTALVDIADLVR